MGREMLDLYNEYFKFPTLTYVLSPGVTAASAGITTMAALLGAVTAVRRAVRIAPAEAMRPEAPARYRRSAVEAIGGLRRSTMAVRMIVRNLERHTWRAVTTIVGIAFASAILQVGFSLIEAMDDLMTTQFNVAERQHTTIAFVEPIAPAVVHAVSRLPGVLRVEPERTVPARIRAGHRARTLAITGLAADPVLRRPIDRDRRVVQPAAEGLVLSAVLGEVLQVAPGDSVTVEVLEGRQPTRQVPVARLVDDFFGVSAYMEIGALRRLLGEGPSWSGAALLIDQNRERELSAALKRLPAVAGVASKLVVLENFRQTMAENMGIMLSFNVLFAGVIAFGVVYNAARVSLSERGRELASLRVLGFTRAEISLILLGELAILTFVALPLGAALGYGLTVWLVSSFESEVYRFPVFVSSSVMAWAALVVVVASLVSGLIVRRRLDRLDLVAVLKLRE